MAVLNNGGWVLPPLATMCCSTDPAPMQQNRSTVLPEQDEERPTCRLTPNRDSRRVTTKLRNLRREVS